MTARPILFSAPMIQALLAGRKTQTRRIINPALPDGATYSGIHYASYEPASWFFNSPIGPFKRPQRYEEGDRLWVREAHRVTSWDEDGAVWISYDADGARSKALEPPDDDFVERLCAKLDKAGVPTQNNGFYADDIPENLLRRVSIHMPRWASRLTLTVTDVRVERLQEISEADAMEEGVTLGRHGFCVIGVEHPNKDFPTLSRPNAREMYAALWDVINGNGAWLANPWVVAITFTVEQRNIDA